jgi:hypothetical protein
MATDTIAWRSSTGTARTAARTERKLVLIDLFNPT